MKNDKEKPVKDQFTKPRKPKTREVSSRFLSSPSSTPTHDSRVLSPTISSPARQKPTATFETKRHQKAHEESNSKSSNLWPSATGISYSSRQSSKKNDTLADHLGIESLKDMLDHDKNIVGSSALYLHRQRSCREDRSFETDHRGGGKKENHRPVLGGSMRYTKKLDFNGKNSSSVLPGRFSVDEKVSKSDFFLDTESECSDMSSSSSRKSGVDVPSRYMNNFTSRRSMLDSNPESSPKLQKFTIKGAIKRASGAATSQWALSPGRTGSSPISNKSRAFSFSAMKPPTSPSRHGVEKLLNMGFDLFKIKKSSPSSTSHESGESIHQIRLLHNRLIQWRTVNARASIANQKIEEQAERNVICAWESLTRLRHSVVQKRLQLEKRRLEMKLNFVLRSQLKPLEEWREMEGQHCSAVSRTAECLNSVVCRVPLKDGAVAELESTWYALRHTSDLTSAVKLNLNALTHPLEEAMPMLVELAKVVSQEKLLMEECLEHIRIISTLEVQEWSLMCSMLQLNPSKQQEQQ